MLGTQIKQKFVPHDHDIFAGLDVDKRSISITFSDHQQHMRSMKIPYKAGHLLRYVDRHYAGRKIAFAYEAGPTGYGLYDDLTQAGYPCLVVSPSLVPTAPGRHVKTNRLDSKKISLALRGGELHSIYVPSPLYRQLRQLVQLRDAMVQQSSAFKYRIRALFLHEGLPFPTDSENTSWSRQLIKEIIRVPCPAPLRFKLDQLLASLNFFHQQIILTTREIRTFCRSEKDLDHSLGLLKSLPGVGFIVATHVLARLGDCPIRNSRQLSGLFGVVPCEYSTGDRISRGRITRAGDRRLRAKLVQAAWAAIRKDPELGDYYLRIYRRHPKPIAARKAIVAVANKLCKRMACILKEQRPYVIRPMALSRPEETAAL